MVVGAGCLLVLVCRCLFVSFVGGCLLGVVCWWLFVGWRGEGGGGGEGCFPPKHSAANQTSQPSKTSIDKWTDGPRSKQANEQDKDDANATI